MTMNRRAFSQKFGFAVVLSLFGLNGVSFAEKKPEKFSYPRNDKNIEPSLSDAKSSMLVLVGDTQRYSNDSVFHSVCDMVYAWIAKKHAKLNIKCALFTGDLVENNNREKLSSAFGDADLGSRGQWNYVDGAFKRLDGKIPYIISPGNHEYGFMCFENRNTRFTEFFKKGRNVHNDKILLEMFPNAFGVPTLENACYKVDLGNGWGEAIIFAVEFCPRDAVLNWVGEKCRTDFSEKKVFLLLHDYLKMDGKRTGKPYFPPKYVIMHKQPDNNGGEDVWQKLVRKTPNIRLVMCGHTGGGTHRISDNTATVVERNDAGKDVVQMVFAQHGRPHDGHGADGWLRTLEFMPNGKTVKVATFSPYLFYSLDTKEKSRPRDGKNEFSFEIL